MSNPQECPNASQLQDLLDGVLPEDLQSQLTTHLESCDRCQHQLELIAGGSVMLPPDGSSPESRSEALEQVMHQLKENVSEDTQTVGQTQAGPLTFDFLRPTNNPRHLGRLGEYEIIELIGRGGMGMVFKARDRKLERLVALKVLGTDLASNGTARQRFLREAQAAAAVTHDHVVTIHAVDEADGMPFLVMEYIVGVSLEDRIQRSGHLRLEEILRIGMQAASGLAAAHAQGLVHRDIKPGNILLENGVERVKITDFGLARVIHEAQLTQENVVAGTPPYMSPEQASAKPVDHRSDLFSLGCVMYAMCVGRSPFRAETPTGTIHRVCEGTPRPIREVNPDIPEWLVAIIDSLLEKDPDDRIQSATDAAEILGQHLAHVQQPSQVALPRHRPRNTSSSRGSLHRLSWTVAAAAICLTACVFGTLEISGITDFVHTSPRLPLEDLEPEFTEGEDDIPPTPDEGTLVLEMTQDQNVRVEITGNRREMTRSSDGSYPLHLPGGRYSVKVFDKAGNRLLRSGYHTVFPGVTTYVKTHWSSVAPLEAQPPVQQEFVTTKYWPLVDFSNEHGFLVVGGSSKITVWKASERCWEPLDNVPDWNQEDVVGLTWLRDGDQLILAERDGTVSLWQPGLETTQTWKLASRFSEKSRIAFSRDGRHLASVEGKNKLWIHDVRTGKAQALGTHGFEITDVDFSPRGDVLATASDTGTVKLWNVAKRNESDGVVESRLLARHTAYVASIDFSPDGRTLASAGRDTTIKLWDVETGEVQQTLTGCVAMPTSVEFSPDGRLVAFAAMGQTVTICNLETGAQRRFHAHWSEARRARFSPDGQHLVTSGSDCVARVWRLADLPSETSPPETRPDLKDKFFGSWHFAVHPSENHLAVFGKGSKLRLWDVDNQRYTRELPVRAKNDYSRPVAFDGTGDHIALLQKTQLERIALLPSSQNLSWASESEEEALAITANGDWIATIQPDGSVGLVDVSEGSQTTVPLVGAEVATSLAFSAPSALLAVGTWSGKVLLLDISDDQKTVATLNQGQVPVTAVCFSPDQSKLSTGNQSGALRIWDVESREELAELDGHSHKIFCLSFSRHGHILVSGGGHALGIDASNALRKDPGIVKLWDLSTYQLQAEFPAHEVFVGQAEFLSDDRHLATTGNGSGVYLWDVSGLLP